MKIYDISQELFSCRLFPGDSGPEYRRVSKISEGDICNLTELSMCAHNGTHVDAPCHFIDGAASIDQVPLEKFIGKCTVIEASGKISAYQARVILEKASAGGEASKRILLKGSDVEMTEEAAEVFAQAGIWLYGNESQTVGPFDDPSGCHKILLGAEVVLLEGLQLEDVPEGIYLLNAAPLNLGGADGAPCRAVLLSI